MKFTLERDLSALEAQLILLSNALLKFPNIFCFLLQEIRSMIEVPVFLHQIIVIADLNVLVVCEFLKKFHLKRAGRNFLFGQW